MRTYPVALRDVRVAGATLAAAVAFAALVPGELGVLCPLRRFTGVPCPLCGMTTSVLATARLDFGAAFRAAPVGIAVALFALLLVVRPRWRVVNLPGWGPSAILGTMWLWQLQRFGQL